MTKILIIEDDAKARGALTEKFRHEGFDVDVAEGGAEGLDQARRLHPDLVLLDLVMPGMDGITMLRKLRAESDWGKSVPVIILTNLSSDTEEAIQDVVELMPAYYLVKADWKLNDIVEKVKDRLAPKT